MTAKTLIIGQGLAGSLLAYRLIQAGTPVLVVDQDHHESSSMAAAGLINPITGKRITKSWLLETLYPEAMALYTELESLFGERLFHPCEAVRLYKDDFERERVAQRRRDQGYTTWLSQKDVTQTPPPVGNREGVGISGAGWVDLPQLLKTFKEWLVQKNAYRTGRLNIAELRVQEAFIGWKGERFERIIFCEGYQAQHNPFFSWLPFKPAKGEILSLETALAKKLNNTLINQGTWALPLGSDLIKVGATYGWAPLDSEPTGAAKKKLLESYEQLLPGAPKAELFEHKAGVRPATLDARPFIGKHPEHPRVMLFNGLGSKGCLLAPFFSKHFSKVILGKEALMPEVDINRYPKG